MGTANSKCRNISDLDMKTDIVIPGSEYISKAKFSPDILTMTLEYLNQDPFGRIFTKVLLQNTSTTENTWIATLENLKLGRYRVQIILAGVNDISTYTNDITYNPTLELNGKQIGRLVENLDYKVGDIYGLNITGDDPVLQNVNCNKNQFTIFFNRITTTGVSETPTNLSSSLVNNDRPIIKILDNKQYSNKGCSGGYCYSSNNCLISNDNIKVEVPLLYIEAKTTIEGSDISDGVFTICDRYQYYEFNKNNETCETKCRKHYAYSDNLLQTKFTKTNLKIVKYLKGDCNTACEKLSRFYEKNPREPTFLIFADNLITYALIRYILSKILFGKFSMKYLLNKYNERFFEELQKSRFCRALEIFTDKNNELYGYYKYFKTDLH